MIRALDCDSGASSIPARNRQLLFLFQPLSVTGSQCSRGMAGRELSLLSPSCGCLQLNSTKCRRGVIVRKAVIRSSANGTPVDRHLSVFLPYDRPPQNEDQRLAAASAAPARPGHAEPPPPDKRRAEAAAIHRCAQTPRSPSHPDDKPRTPGSSGDRHTGIALISASSMNMMFARSW